MPGPNQFATCSGTGAILMLHTAEDREIAGQRHPKYIRDHTRTGSAPLAFFLIARHVLRQVTVLHRKTSPPTSIRTLPATRFHRQLRLSRQLFLLRLSLGCPRWRSARQRALRRRRQWTISKKTTFHLPNLMTPLLPLNHIPLYRRNMHNNNSSSRPRNHRCLSPRLPQIQI